MDPSWGPRGAGVPQFSRGCLSLAVQFSVLKSLLSQLLQKCCFATSLGGSVMVWGQWMVVWGELQHFPSFSSWFDSGLGRDLAGLQIPEPPGSGLGLFPADPSGSGSRTTLDPRKNDLEIPGKYSSVTLESFLPPHGFQWECPVCCSRRRFLGLEKQMNYFSLSYFVAGRSKTIVWKIYKYKYISIYISIFIITVYKTSLNFH